MGRAAKADDAAGAQAKSRCRVVEGFHCGGFPDISANRGKFIAMGAGCFPNDRGNLSGEMNLLQREPSLSQTRAEALQETGLLDTVPEAQFDRFTRLVCRWLNVPVALVSLVDQQRNRQFFKSAQGLAALGAGNLRSTPLSHSICRLVVEEESVLAIDDTRVDGRCCDHPAVRELGVGAYLGAPLITDEGIVLGSLCAIAPEPRRWTEADKATMVDLAALVMTEIGIRTTQARRVAQLEAEVRSRTASLNTTLGEMEEFSYMVSHDLRAPLRRIKCYSEILAEDAASRLMPAEAESLRRVIKSTLGMEELLNAVLPILRLARMEVNPLPVNLDETVRQSIAGHPDLAARAAAFAVEPLGEALGQSGLLEQVFTHLLRNAVKFVPAGVRPQVSVMAKHEHDRVWIGVKDNGIGIPPAYHERIFGVFSRLHPEANYPGNGLGLNTVAKILKRLNGAVRVESDGVSGSIFWVELPAVDESWR